MTHSYTTSGDLTKKDNEDFGIESCFLANVAPKARVDYVIVAMEPSRPANIDSIKNFAVSVEDFILHFCASEYLCKGESTYHITDLSKGAMRVTDASSSPALRYERYKRWYPLLCEEIELMARPNAPIIPWGIWCVIFSVCRKCRGSKKRFCTTHRVRQATDLR